MGRSFPGRGLLSTPKPFRSSAIRLIQGAAFPHRWFAKVYQPASSGYFGLPRARPRYPFDRYAPPCGLVQRAA